MANTSTSGQFNSPVDFRLSLQPPKSPLPQLQPMIDEIYNSLEQVFQTLINNCGIGPQLSASWTEIATQNPASTLLEGNLTRLYVKSSEQINFGAAINLFNNSGVLFVRNANAASGAVKHCHGFCSASGGIASQSYGEVQLGHGVAVIGSLTVGQEYWLASSGPGLVANAPQTAAGQLEQFLGVAIDTTHLWFNTGYWTQH